MDTPSSVPFNNRLQKYRSDRFLSQGMLARRAKFDHSHVSRLEQGTRNPTRSSVSRLGEALQLSSRELGVLLVSAGFMPDNIDVLMEPVIYDLANILSDENVPPEKRDRLRKMLELLAVQMQEEN